MNTSFNVSLSLSLPSLANPEVIIRRGANPLPKPNLGVRRLCGAVRCGKAELGKCSLSPSSRLDREIPSCSARAVDNTHTQSESNV